MTIEKKLELLEDMLEMNAGELKVDAELANLENWDSMAKLSLIVLMDDEFGKEISGEQIRGFKTVQDILDFME